jgi:hypothetical protein
VVVARSFRGTEFRGIYTWSSLVPFEVRNLEEYIRGRRSFLLRYGTQRNICGRRSFLSRYGIRRNISNSRRSFLSRYGIRKEYISLLDNSGSKGGQSRIIDPPSLSVFLFHCLFFFFLTQRSESPVASRDRE